MIKIVDLLKEEIDNGFINKNKLEEKVAAFLEFVNNDFRAFDVKIGEQRRITFEDCVCFSFKKDKNKVSLKVVSPRLTNGEYVCAGIILNNFETRGFIDAGEIKVH